jgi:hypothetical protein
MAHFAKLDQNNVVTEVVVVSNDVATNEEAGVSFLRNLYKEPTANWKQTSYNSTIRKNFAGVGYIYDNNNDAFIPPKPYNSWILNEDTCKWEAPIVRPEGSYQWNEETQTWDIKQ